ncbi:MAG TPA: MotA/TolQ/ExbB proton channel family protein [Ginsengibacter sp.]|nr:MotA/TolQ/ExbB proton channel family protein [Chitinophagaceae bacterium]HRN71854.1 MotA/TolQ/ExbB proton channel family protein [Ginsengibacter sp.]HRP18097.1 MotA/TolQ/ExbB proton channel family protein [Ginsengibacter sp.]HRP45456.1 MotA/TolQ/ExbB proton channel family protein [Ginsengibacter sp.]
MDLFLLQVDSLSTASQISKSQSLWDVLVSGGVLMIPLGLLFVAAIYFFFERYIAINRASKLDNNFMQIIRDHIISGNVTAARSFSKNNDNPVARIVDKGIQRIGKPMDAIEKSMENVGVLELYKLEKNLSIISIIARIAPLFGFLGTIIGMLALFRSIATSPEYTPNTIADGIYIKMITSATGLIIGILAYIGHSYLSAQINRVQNKMEIATAEFTDILQEPTR